MVWNVEVDSLELRWIFFLVFYGICDIHAKWSCIFSFLLLVTPGDTAVTLFIVFFVFYVLCTSRKPMSVEVHSLEMRWNCFSLCFMVSVMSMPNGHVSSHSFYWLPPVTLRWHCDLWHPWYPCKWTCIFKFLLLVPPGDTFHCFFKSFVHFKKSNDDGLKGGSWLSWDAMESFFLVFYGICDIHANGHVSSHSFYW